MKVVLIGASGMIGSRILKELVSRGHQVTAVVRNPSKVESRAGVKLEKCDVSDGSAVGEILKGADAVISAYGPPTGSEQQLIEVTRGLLAAAGKAGVRRVIIVGGAASLFVAPGVTLLESGHLPEEWQAIATAHRDLLELLRETDAAAGLEWTYFSPAGLIEPGERKGTFRLGRDDLVVDGQGQSRISAEDYAIALVDELEQSRYVGERFTVGY
jgi:putative NADH-flavin reductase